jgi:hypothetical protein
MELVIVVPIAADLQQDLGFVGLVVAIGIGEEPEVRCGADENLGSACLWKDAETERGAQFGALEKCDFLVGDSVCVRVFENDDAIAFGTELFPILV